MSATTTHVARPDGTALCVYQWASAGAARGVVHLAHGMAEHTGRWTRLAEALRDDGWAVYAHDHRGHGRSVASPAGLGVFGPDGWNALVADLSAVHASIRARHPALPVVAFGHSMGSYAVQQLVLDESASLAAVVLSGSSALDQVTAGVDPSEPLSLSAFNAPFEPARTPFDWLSRDTAEVDAYVADPYCGFTVGAPAVADMAAAASRLADPAALAAIRKTLPFYVVAGDADPLNAGMALLELLAGRYRAAGLTDVTLRGYPGARHELFNEINRDDVTRDLLAWLHAQVPGPR
jgi:alpha-beta hydrolase superfamily lysophospholipase